MKKILFVCHGNICRSPMAEFILKEMVREAGVGSEFEISSAAVSTEETGNDMYPPAKRMLQSKNIPFTRRSARQISRSDYSYYDYIICMDQSNIRWMRNIIGEDSEHKVSLLLQWKNGELINHHLTNGKIADVADPWYTGDFSVAYRDIEQGCRAILKQLRD